jgi:hypothetical protein
MRNKRSLQIDISRRGYWYAAAETEPSWSVTYIKMCPSGLTLLANLGVSPATCDVATFDPQMGWSMSCVRCETPRRGREARRLSGILLPLGVQGKE